MPHSFMLRVQGRQEVRGVLGLPTPAPAPVLEPGLLWGYLLHDYQLGDYWGAEKVGKTRWAPNTHGDPETVTTYRKEERVSLTPAWQEFHKLMFTLAAFGEARLSLFAQLENAFESVMAPNRVITNKVGYPEGYMPLLMGGNVVRLVSDTVYRPNALFGLSYKIETLDASKSPPDVEEVFWKKPWLWSKATVARYAFSGDGVIGLESPWQHVIPFPQLDAWHAHVPLLNISYGGWNYVQTARVRLISGGGNPPNAYNPARAMRFG